MNLPTSNITDPQGYGALGMLLDPQFAPLVSVLQKMSAFKEDETDYTLLTAEKTATLQSRAEGAGYTADQWTPGAPTTGSQKFVGDSLAIDETRMADEKLGFSTVKKRKDRELRTKFMSWARLFDAALLQGAGTTTLMKGLKTILDGSTDIPGFTGVKGYYNAKAASTDTTPVDLDLTDSANFENFVDMMFLKLAAVPNLNAILCNYECWGRITAIFRKLNALGENRDFFGVPIPSFNNIPIYPMLSTSITNTEPDDTAVTTVNETTSIYLARFSEIDLAFATNSGLSFKTIPDPATQNDITKWEIRGAWQPQEKDCVLRIAKIRAIPASA